MGQIFYYYTGLSKVMDFVFKCNNFCKKKDMQIGCAVMCSYLVTNWRYWTRRRGWYFVSTTSFMRYKVPWNSDFQIGWLEWVDQPPRCTDLSPQFLLWAFVFKKKNTCLPRENGCLHYQREGINRRVATVTQKCFNERGKRLGTI